MSADLRDRLADALYDTPEYRLTHSVADHFAAALLPVVRAYADGRVAEALAPIEAMCAERESAAGDVAFAVPKVMCIRLRAAFDAALGGEGS